MKKIILLLLITACFSQQLIQTKEFRFYKDTNSTELDVMKLINEKKGIFKVELLFIEDIKYERTKQILYLPCELELSISSKLSSNIIDYKLCKTQVMSNQSIIVNKEFSILTINYEKFNYIEGTFIFRISGEYKNTPTTSEKANNGILREWYDNGSLYLEFTMQNGIKHGTCKKWYKNGVPQIIYNYNNGKLEGNQRKWYLNGINLGDWNYSNDILHGISKEWYDSGKVKSIKKYDNGTLIAEEFFNQNANSH